MTCSREYRATGKQVTTVTIVPQRMAQVYTIGCTLYALDSRVSCIRAAGESREVESYGLQTVGGSTGHSGVTSEVERRKRQSYWTRVALQ